MRLHALACVLAALVLAGCERGSMLPGRATEPVPTFVLPSDADNVFEVGREVPVRVIEPDAPMPGNALSRIHLTVYGVGAALRQQRVEEGGVTSALVRGQQPGPLRLQARLDGAASMATRWVHLRPPPVPLGLLVPAYFDPGSWDRMTAVLRRQPQLSIVAIVNPDDGHFDSAEPELAAALARFVAAGGRAVGYVETRYGRGRPTLEQVRANIDDYVVHYGAAISGFFIDEVPDAPADIAFFEAVRNHIRQRYPQHLIVGNPGTFPAAAYATVADTLVTFEGTAADYLRMDPQPEHTWIYRRSNGANAALVHDATCPLMRQVLRRAAAARSNTGWIYATDLHYDYPSDTGDPWAELPSYWGQLAVALVAVNQGREPPPC